MTDLRAPTRSRENTRARLLDAAFEVFADVGLDAASVEAICEHAGFTRGAFYSNFESKDQLFMELVTVVAERKLEAVTERVRMLEAADAPARPADIVRRIVDVAVDDRRGALLMGEIRIRAMRDPRTGEAYRAWQAGMALRVEAIIGDIVRAYGLTLRIPAPDFAAVVLSVWETTSMNALVDGLDYAATCALVGARTEQLAEGLVEGFTR